MEEEATADTTAPDNDDIPIFPAVGPPVFHEAGPTRALFDPVLDRLADLVDAPEVDPDAETPCRGFTFGDLRQHVLGWLDFFAVALNDPTGGDGRPDPSAWQPPAGASVGEVVASAAGKIGAAVDRGVAGELVLMAEARMHGHAVLAMALGEYLVHGWDLAVASGRQYAIDEPTLAAAGPALAFLQTTVASEYRGPDSGFFDAEVAVPSGADDFVRLLCFTGRSPDWHPGR